MLCEFLEYGQVYEPYEKISCNLKELMRRGFRPVLAHPERYKAMQEDRERLRELWEAGVLMQVNAYDLFLNPKDATRNLAQWMAEEELISFIGSDMHGTRIKADGKPARRPQMKEGISWLYENVDYDYACEIVRINAERYLGVGKLL